MNDDRLNKLFKDDNSSPKKPVNEWPDIVAKIDQEKTSFNFFPPIAASMFVLTLVIIGMSVRPNFERMYDDELAEYMFFDSYLQTEEELSFYSE